MRPVHPVLLRSWLVLTLCYVPFARPIQAADRIVRDGSSDRKILVLPFTALNKSDYESWLGRSIQQSVVADLTVAALGHILTADTEAMDASTAIDAGRKAGARFVVRGNFATLAQIIRVTGEVLDLNSDKTVASLKVTGSLADVFALEDRLADQIRNRLALNPPKQKELAPLATVATMEPVRVQPQPADPYTQTYVMPLQNNAPAGQPQAQYNYYFTNPANGYFYVPGLGLGWTWPGWTLGVGVGYDDPYEDRAGYCASSNHWQAWNGRAGNNNRTSDGSVAAGIANSENGTPLGGVGTSYSGAGPLSAGTETTVSHVGTHRVNRRASAFAPSAVQHGGGQLVSDVRSIVATPVAGHP